MESFSREYLEELMVSVAYHAAVMEGSSLTYEAVRNILMRQEIAGSMTIQEFFEIENYRHAFQLMFHELAQETKFSIIFIKNLHRKLLDRLVPDAGHFKRDELTSKEAKAKEIAFRMIDWCHQIKKELKTCQRDEDKLAAILRSHDEFKAILPFNEGNGHVGQMLLVFLCLSENLPPILVTEHAKRS